MKKKRNTFAAQLRNCSTVEERFRLVLTGQKENVIRIVSQAVMLKAVELDTKPRRKYRGLAQKCRAGLEAEIGKLVLRLVMAGDVAALRALVKEIERDLANEIVPDKMQSGFVLCAAQPQAPQVDRLRLALFAIGPGRYTWKELEARLRDFGIGNQVECHEGDSSGGTKRRPLDRAQVRRTIKELGLKELPLFRIGQRHYTWKELEARLSDCHHNRRILRKLKELGFDDKSGLTIIPGASGRHRKPGTRKRIS